jgi:hypothetical protein
MINENYNNESWRSKLEEPQSHTDAGFNKDAAWKKLHDRLQTKKKNVLWYWIAAAASLLIILISFLFINKKENVLVKNILPQKNNVIIKSVPAEIPDQNNLKNSALVVNTNPIHSSNKKQFKIISNKKRLPSLSVQDKEETIAKDEVKNNSIIPPDTITALAFKPVVIKNKLKIVHLNELGESTTDFGGNEKNKEYASSALKFMNHQEYSLPSSTVKTGIKIFSTN